MAKKKASKSQQKRVEVQSPVDTACVPNAAVIAGLAAAVERIEALETQNALITESYKFAADQLRGLYMCGPIAIAFDAIHEKLSK